jgi:AGZA family xanthine/uracil permease-like MFS transporter
MFRSIREIDFSEFRFAVPAFLTVILMPLTFSIANGLAVGFISFTVISLLSGEVRKISMVMWVVSFLAAVNLLI